MSGENSDIDTIDATKAQLKVLSYCSALFTQMFLHLFQTQRYSRFHSLKEGIRKMLQKKLKGEN